MPRDTAVHSRGRGKRPPKGTTRVFVKPQITVTRPSLPDPSPAGQLRRGKALDKKGRQKVLVKAKPRPVGQRGQIYRDSGGDVRVLPRKVYVKRVKAQARANVKRKTYEKTMGKSKPLRAIQPGNTGTTRILGINPERELNRAVGGIADLGHALGKSAVRQQQIGRKTGTAGFDIGNVFPKEADAFTQDTFDIPANAPASAVGLGSAVVQASRGNKKPLKEMGHQFAQHDPLYLGATGLLTGNTKKLKRAGQEARKHPGATALELYGGARGLSIGGGMAARSGALGSRLREAASIKGRDRVVPGNAIVEKRAYSKGAVGQAAQKRKDRVRRAKARNLYQQAEREAQRARESGDNASFGRADDLQAQAMSADPKLAPTGSKRSIRRPTPPRNIVHERIDQRQALAESRRRGNRSREVGKVSGKLEVSPAAQLVAQAIVAPTRESFMRYHDRLLAQYRSGHLGKAEERANANTRNEILKALKDFDPVKISVDAQRYTDVVNPLQHEMVDRGIVAPAQARLAKLVPYAREHMGLTHDEKPVKSEAQHRFEGLRQAERDKAKEIRDLLEKEIPRRAVTSARQEGGTKVRVSLADRLTRKRKGTPVERPGYPHVERVPVSDLRRLPGNELDTGRVAHHRGKIDRRGDLDEPIIVEYDPDTGYARLAEGNHRLAAAQEAGLKDVPVQVMRARVPAERGAKISEPGQHLVNERGDYPSIATPSQAGLRGTPDVQELGRRPASSLRALEDRRGKLGLAEQQLARAKAEFAVIKKQRQNATVKKADRTEQRFRDENGRAVTVEEIERHMQSEGAHVIGAKHLEHPISPDRHDPADQIRIMRGLAEDRQTFARLGKNEKVWVFHGTAGHGAGHARDATYVTLNPALARQFAKGAEVRAIAVRKGDLRPSPEAVSAGARTAEESLFENGEAIIARGDLGTAQVIDPHRPIAGQLQDHTTPVVDPRQVAFQTHAPGQRGAQNFFISPGPKGINSHSRSGNAAVRGTFALDSEVPKENVARMQGLIDAHNEYAELIKENAFRGEDGEVKRFANKRLAEEYRDEKMAQYGENAPGSQKWVAIPTRPQFGKRAQSEALLRQADQDVPINMHDIDEALQGEGDGQYVLAHADAVQRQREHLGALGANVGQKALRAGVGQFRSVVLTTSPSWITGNIVEGLLRAGVAGVKPQHVAFARAVEVRLREIDPVAADEFRHRVGEGHFGVQELQRIRSSVDAYENTILGPLARSLVRLRNAPGAKTVADAWNDYTHAVFGGSGFMEAQIKMGMAGKAIADLIPDKNILLDWRTAVEQAAQGLVKTEEQVRVARWLDDAYGKYGAFSPSTRNLISQYTPFLAWTINAFKFVTTVLPRDHPVLTGLIASNYIATEKWRQDMGLGKGKGSLPYWLKGALPFGDTWRDVTRYTPFGAWRSPLDAAANTVLPQFRGIINAGGGLDWKGDSLVKNLAPDRVDEMTKMKAALGSFLGSSIPLLAQVKRGIEKPGNPLDKIGATLNPVRGIKRQDPKLAVTFDKLKENEARKAALRGPKKHPHLYHGRPMTAENPSPEYTRLLAEHRKLEADKYRLSKGEYGEAPSKKKKTIFGGPVQTEGGGSNIYAPKGSTSTGKSIFK